ncbi:titin isoform X2 [Tribolium castaneum]|uniref:Chromo domain-containing protein n=1 Tax=Tribolium castaneum TaxID=7070 RepID=A0A139WBL9_TRICA|nr:PREDICTED: titin isoform X2 [Tribolium castaneum]KYB25329.1 hypothetical protein TcasGA2_TC012645 [Tribolium castaneum]|eukprot:XP_008198187.1 PREDICTED: titin isoform X2 [Tribolium castaneum]
MESTATDPLDISKDEELITDAQKELSKSDVLVCGGCHETFHFIEEFQSHKAGECTNVSVLKCENEEKPQIWGFTLWKNKHLKTIKSQEEPVPSSWEIYQKWTKLEQPEKDTWISAGKTLLSVTRVVNGKPLRDNTVEKDPLAMDDGAETENQKTGIRTLPEKDKEEYNVEKIVGKRFNPRKRYWEYEVKWENYSELTWEPLLHLENCKDLVQEFEAKLKAEKEKDKPPGTGRGRGRPRLNPQTPGAVKVVPKKPVAPPPVEDIALTPGGRPQRTSKQKALNQVKAWCGNISDDEGGGKRPYDDDADSDDSFEKKIRIDGESEDTEEDEPRTPARKVAKIIHTYNNGVGKKLPDNVLIPDAKGVVRISQKQLPSLSSGVYIMSKSSGIIKLDPTASKIATSGGQAIVKVSPKIGQTQIRIIKKEDGSKRVVQVKGPEQQHSSVVASKPRIIQHVVTKTAVVRKEPEKIVRKVETPKPKPVEKKQEAKTSHPEEDSDDGLPELEFPTDLPLPQPESPPQEFTLDPTTGKVVGVDYPEPEPKPETKEPNEESPSQTLDNIVKLAAADITEDDLKPDTEPIITTENTPETTAETPATTTSTVYSVVTGAKTGQSILIPALPNTNILQKTLQSPRPKTQPRIINQSVTKPRPAMTPVQAARPAAIRPKTPLPKPKFNIAPLSPTKNVYSPKSNNVAKKIGNTTIYRTKSPAAPQPVVKKSPPKVVASAPISMPSLDEEPVEGQQEATVEGEVPTMTFAATDRPMYITGDDGTVYQVAGQNEEGQTILVTQDSEGQQQCLLVTGETVQEAAEQQSEEATTQMLMEQDPEEPLVVQFMRAEPPSPGGTHKVLVKLPDGNVMVTQVTPEEYASLEL